MVLCSSFELIKKFNDLEAEMPYAIKGKTVVKKNTGEVVGHSSNPKKYLRVLQAVEHGWKPSGKRKHHSASDGAFLERLKKKFGVQQ